MVDLSLEKDSLSAILCSQVLHFLRGEELELAANLMYRWLKPGGKVFSISGTAYAKNIRKVIPVYEQRASQGWRWPGEIANIHSFSTDITVKELPDFFHALDPLVLQRTFQKAGFHIEKSEFFARKNVPPYIHLDGRENVILVAQKPI